MFGCSQVCVLLFEKGLVYVQFNPLNAIKVLLKRHL